MRNSMITKDQGPWAGRCQALPWLPCTGPLPPPPPAAIACPCLKPLMMRFQHWAFRCRSLPEGFRISLSLQRVSQHTMSALPSTFTIDLSLISFVRDVLVRPVGLIIGQYGVHARQRILALNTSIGLCAANHGYCRCKRRFLLTRAMFDRAAHEQALPRSSGAGQVPCMTARHSCLRCREKGNGSSLKVNHRFVCSLSTPSRFRCRRSRAQQTCRAEAATSKDRHPTVRQAKAFAPATIANLGPGFDWMGCAVEVSRPADR